MLTVLGYEGPQLRAYLLFLEARNVTIDHLVLLAPDIDVATKKPVARFMPKTMRSAMGLKLLGMRMNHWPGIIALRHVPLFTSITHTMDEHTKLPDDFYTKLLKPFQWRSFAARVDVVPMNGSLKDSALHTWLSQHVKGAVLYTGGGIVPSSLLAIDGVRIIHVHPGYLPHVRGADGLLWSALLRKKFGVSGFYMEPGIDTGDLLFAKEQELIRFKGAVGDNVDGQVLYRALFAFVDPVIRAQALCELLKGKQNLMALPASVQDTSEGETFHFMHPALRNQVLTQLFPQWGG